MGTRAMKFDSFVLKALEKKGYTLPELVKLSDDEIEELNLSDTIIQAVKSYKARGGRTQEEVAKEIAAIMEEDDVTNLSTEEKDKLKVELNDTKRTMTIDVGELSTEEAVQFIEDIKEVVNNKTQSAPDTEEVVRTVAKKEDIDTVKDVLQKKELRSFATYIKFLKSEVPAVILESIESTTLNDLISARIEEVKAQGTK
ncbi:hypothetical protein XaC1_382 [Xanthomonas phage XaC1]|nr:hypothetical protein XaC1_382 [Xanthomonas phage XaC1]